MGSSEQDVLLVKNALWRACRKSMEEWAQFKKPKHDADMTRCKSCGTKGYRLSMTYRRVGDRRYPYCFQCLAKREVKDRGVLQY